MADKKGCPFSTTETRDQCGDWCALWVVDQCAARIIAVALSQPTIILTNEEVGDGE